MAPLVATVAEWGGVALLAVPLALILTFFYKLVQDQRNPHAWRKRR